MEDIEQSGPSKPDDEGHDDSELSLEELEAEDAGTLPDRQAMSLIDASVTIPANPALAADVLSDTLEDARGDDDPEVPGEDPTG